MKQAIKVNDKVAGEYNRFARQALERQQHSEFREGVWGNPFFRQKRGSPNGGPGGDPLVGGLEGKVLQHKVGSVVYFFEAGDFFSVDIDVLIKNGRRSGPNSSVTIESLIDD